MSQRTFTEADFEPLVLTVCGARECLHSHDRADRIRNTVRVCIERGLIPRTATRPTGARLGISTELARHFGVSRQRIHQAIRDCREALDTRISE